MVLIFTKETFFLLKQIFFLVISLTTLKEQLAQILLFFVVNGLCYACCWRLKARLVRHKAQMLALGFDQRMEKPGCRRKTKLILAGA